MRPAAPMQLANGQFYQPWVYGPSAGLAPAPYWNYPVESWVRAPQGQLGGMPPNAPVQQGWEAGFTPEARGTQPPVSQPGADQTSQSTTPSESRPSATATPAAGRGSRQMLKLQRYTGADSLETFLRKFNSMKQYLQWNKDDAMYHLCGSLEGAAGQVLEGLPTTAKTADIIKLLETRFGTKLQAEHFKAELLA